MSLLAGFLEFMTNSLPGAICDTVGGRAMDGDRFSSFENYVRPESNGQNPDITINAGALHINTPKVEIVETVPAPEVAPVAVPQDDQEQYQGHRL